MFVSLAWHYDGCLNFRARIELNGGLAINCAAPT